MFRKIQGIAAFLLLFSIFLHMLAPQAEAADPKIKISIEPGFDGYIKRSMAMPMKVQIENKGEAFSGTLMFQFQPTYEYGGAQALKVELPKGSSKTYSISLPGYTDDNYNGNVLNKSIYLYEGDWQDGNEVDYSGPKILTPKYYDESQDIIGVLSQKYDRLTELRVLPSTDSTMIELTKEELPSRSMGLEMLSYLIIDEYEIAALDAAQQEALKGWIKSGGILIAGASPNGGQQYGSIYDLLPMKMDKEVKLETALFAKKEKDRPSFSYIPGFIGDVEKGAEIVTKSGEFPAIVKKQYGNGIIVQTGFSLGDQPLASWKGYGTWLEKILNQADINSFSSTENFLEQAQWELNEPNSYFDDTTLSIGQLLFLLCAYIVIIVPILYIVLKKIDKREHAWWIIPLIACITSVLTFTVGAKDRLAQPQLNQLGIYHSKDGQLVGLQSDVLLSNKGGDYALSFPKNEMTALPMTQESLGGNIKRSPILEEKAIDTELIFPNVEYWSTRSLLGKVYKGNVGQFKTDLTVENKTLTGTIHNETPYDFKELLIMSGQERINLGKLKKGETITVKEKLKGDFLIEPYAVTSGPMNNWNAGQKMDLDKIRRDQLLYVTETFFFSGVNADTDPVIAGVTSDSIVDIKVSKKPKKNIDNLIFQTFDPETILSGDVTLSKEMFQSWVDVIRGSYDEDAGIGEHWFEIGEYEYISQVPLIMKDDSFKAKQLSIKFSKQKIKYELYNFSTEKYEPIPFEERSISFEGQEEISSYISKEGDIQIKIIKESEDESSLRMPEINVKGEVTK
ncbi:hypothetical protein [Peribacillus butanolivorans]|uniref:hypothetical protein n=1 Tax=Peribacillus butanolivorans TaxID=421767 RepID=UPI0036D87AF8